MIDRVKELAREFSFLLFFGDIDKTKSIPRKLRRLNKVYGIAYGLKGWVFYEEALVYLAAKQQNLDISKYPEFFQIKKYLQFYSDPEADLKKKFYGKHKCVEKIATINFVLRDLKEIDETQMSNFQGRLIKNFGFFPYDIVLEGSTRNYIIHRILTEIIDGNLKNRFEKEERKVELGELLFLLDFPSDKEIYQYYLNNRPRLEPYLRVDLNKVLKIEDL